jgi:hypothetical protein
VNPNTDTACDQGVIDWAGGLIQYNESEYVAAGSKFAASLTVTFSWRSLDQYEALVSQVVVQCSTDPNLTITPGSLSYMYGANDTSGVPTVYASNHTGLLSGAPSARVPMWPLALFALGSVALAL